MGTHLRCLSSRAALTQGTAPTSLAALGPLVMGTHLGCLSSSAALTQGTAPTSRAYLGHLVMGTHLSCLSSSAALTQGMATTSRAFAPLDISPPKRLHEPLCFSLVSQMGNVALLTRGVVPQSELSSTTII